MQKIILGIGGAHIDRRGQIAVDFVPGASNPGTMREDVGGGTFNALRNAVQRGIAGWIMSVRGGDTTGETVARAIADAGISDLSVTFLDRRTPSYTALLDRRGEVIAALADMGLYDIAFAKQLRRAAARDAASKADAIFCDANLSIEALLRIPKLAGGKPVFAIAVSPAKAVRLAPILPDLACLFLNTREAGALTGLGIEATTVDMARALRKLDVKRAVLSSGGNPVLAFDEQAPSPSRPPHPGISPMSPARATRLSARRLRQCCAAQRSARPCARASPPHCLHWKARTPWLHSNGQAFEAALALVPAPQTLQEADFEGAPHVA